MKIIAENYKHDAVVEVDNQYYVVRLNREKGQVQSTVHGDMPRDGGTWLATMSDGGVKYVASARTRSAAMATLRRLEPPLTLAMTNGQGDHSIETRATDLYRAAKRAWPYARDYEGTCRYRAYNECDDLVDEGTF